MSRMATQHIHVLLTQLHCNSDFQCLIRHVSDHGGVLDVTGSPRLVTLRLESLMRDPSGISHAYGRRRAFADEHMPVPTGPGPRRSTQSIYNTRLSEVHTSHHGSTGLPPGTAGEPKRHAEEVQGERVSECVDGISEANENSRNEDASATTSSGRASLEPERRPKASTGKERPVVRRPEVSESSISDVDSGAEVEDEDDEQTSEDEYGTDQGFQPGFPTPRGAAKRNVSKSEPKRANGTSDGSKESVEQTPAELMREMLKRAKRGDTKAQNEIMQLMKAMQGCMEAEESEEDDEPEDEAERQWSPKRESQTDERKSRPTPPTRAIAKASTKETKTTKETRRIDMYKVSIDQIDDSSAGALQNSLYMFRDFLEQANIPEKEGDEIDDKNLRMAVNKWCKGKATIITSLRNTFGESGRGDERLQHVIEIFIQPKVKQRDIDPEKELANYKYSKLFAGNGLVFHTELDKFREILARLPEAVKGEPRHWIARVELHAGSKILFWLDRVVRGEPRYLDIATSWVSFGKAMAEALNMFRQYEGEPEREKPFSFAHQTGGRAEQKDKCSGCNGWECPKAKSSSATCDVYGNVSQARAKEILDKPMAKLWTDQQRINAEKPPINYPQPTAAQKEALEAYDVRKAEIAASKGKGKGKSKGKGKGGKGRQQWGSRANSHTAPIEEEEKQDILDKGMAMLEQMRNNFGMQTHAVISPESADEPEVALSQLTLLRQMFPGTSEPSEEIEGYAQVNCHSAGEAPAEEAIVEGAVGISRNPSISVAEIKVLLLSHGYRISGVEQDLLIKTDGAGTIRIKLHVDDGAGWSNSRTLHEELCSVMQEVWPNSKWDGDKDDPMSFSISRERVQPMTGSISMHSMESTQDESTWDYDDYMSVEPRFEALLESCDETELIPALSVADIDTCEEAVKYSPDEMHTQLIESSNTAVHVSILKVIIDSAKELIRLERVEACNPVVRMAAPAQQEGQAIESQIAGEQPKLEPKFSLDGARQTNEPERGDRLTASYVDGRNTQTTTVAGIQATTVAGRVRIEPKFEALLEGCDEAYLITALSMADIETCEEAVEYSPEEMHERLLRSSDTAVQVSTLKMIIDNTKEMLRLERIGAWNPFVRSVEPSTYSGTETESYSEQHVSAEEREARHKSTVSRTRMNVSGKHVTISQGTSTMSVITSPDSNTAESTCLLYTSDAADE